MIDPKDLENAKKRLRSYLNPSIRGPNTEAILEALATGAAHLITNVEAVNDQLYIATAQGRYLDQRLGDRNITRPDNVGLSDDVFRALGIEISNRKQVRDLILQILRVIYGEEFTRATVDATEFEPYNLKDGDNLIVQYDDQEPIEIFFNSSQFTNINAATSQEIADSITREIRRLGRIGSAISRDDGFGFFTQLISETDGPSSSVKVLGGSAQNKLKFPQIKPTSGLATTQWTFQIEPGGIIRLIWSGGPNPSIGKVGVGDYVNIFGTAFDDRNKGTYTVTRVQSGTVGNAFVEFLNVNGVAETQLQGSTEGVLFFNPQRFTINSKNNFASLFQVSPGVLEIFLPATTKVVRRERLGAAHIQETIPAIDEDFGPYIWDPSKTFLIAQPEANTTQEVNSSSLNIIEVDNSSDIPDEFGFLIFGFGTELEEGPVPYISRPSSNTVIIDPSYVFKNNHVVGTNVSLVAQNSSYEPDRDGTDYPFYITDIVTGRVYAQELINLVAATGINVVITILYPGDEGLGKWGDEQNSEKFFIWGDDLV